MTQPSGAPTGDGSRAAAARWHTAARGIAGLGIAICLVLIVRALPLEQATDAAKTWVESQGLWGPVVLIGMYIVATILFVPGTILSLVAGATFGLVVGVVIVSIGSVSGAALAFLIARYVARDRVAQLATRNVRFHAIDQAIGEGGWKIVALLRLSPAIPFNLQNYLYGLTPIRFWPYVLTSWIAMLPGTFLYVYLGHITGAALGVERTRSTAEWIFLAIGLLATLVVTVYITRLAQRKLQAQVNAPTVTEGEQPVGGEVPLKPPSALKTFAWICLAAALAGVAVFMQLDWGILGTPVK